MTLIRTLFIALSIFLSSYFLFFHRGKSAANSQQPYFESSSLYDWGWHGISPLQRYRSFHQRSIKPNLIRKNSRCSTDLLFVEPRSKSGVHPLMIFNNDGHLVWMPSQSEFHNARDFQVHSLKGQRYITFLAGKGAAGNGDAYTMVS